MMNLTDAPYAVGNAPAADEAVLSALAELTPRWQSFAVDPMPDARRTALMRLVLCGFAKMRMAYKVTNQESGEWYRLRFIVAGTFPGDLVMKHIAALCPPGWFSDDLLHPTQGIRVADEPHNWWLAITDDGDRLRKLPDNQWLVLNTVRCHNAPPVVLKDGSESGRDILRAETPKVFGPVKYPENQDVRDLCAELAKPRNGRSMNAIARDFVGGDEKKAASLLRQCREFPHLWRSGDQRGE